MNKKLRMMLLSASILVATNSFASGDVEIAGYTYQASEFQNKGQTLLNKHEAILTKYSDKASIIEDALKELNTLEALMDYTYGLWHHFLLPFDEDKNRHNAVGRIVLNLKKPNPKTIVPSYISRLDNLYDCSVAWLLEFVDPRDLISVFNVDNVDAVKVILQRKMPAYDSAKKSEEDYIQGVKDAISQLLKGVQILRDDYKAKALEQYRYILQFLFDGFGVFATKRHFSRPYNQLLSELGLRGDDAAHDVIRSINKVDDARIYSALFGSADINQLKKFKEALSKMQDIVAVAFKERLRSLFDTKIAQLSEMH